MKSTTRASGITVLSSTAFVAMTFLPAVCAAEALPKQGAIEATYVATGNDVRELKAGGDDAVYLFESTLLMTNNQKTPLMHNVTARCVEAGFSASSATGYCVYTDKDGDKFVETYSYPGGSTSGKGTLGAGTGKYKGIEGKFDWQQVQVLPADKGSYSYIGEKMGSYRIP
ncbi:hypothetical protein AWB79_00703 [Caballeronia hypogeia]|uniref:Lipoprotein n=1 Tax=Caballeronia hypogeia TaxID=1777140 RepID=A0A157ZDP9_9BURK|nr:hypothetical protein [Caballeronia hypogeia]SAK43644.1 hypothetical protein AWB79_00703 [Caballeronia hypogeia]